MFSSWQALCWVLDKVIGQMDVILAPVVAWEEGSYRNGNRKVKEDQPDWTPAWLKQCLPLMKFKFGGDVWCRVGVLQGDNREEVYTKDIACEGQKIGYEENQRVWLEHRKRGKRGPWCLSGWVQWPGTAVGFRLHSLGPQKLIEGFFFIETCFETIVHTVYTGNKH